jgi:hypothetical protein
MSYHIRNFVEWCMIIASLHPTTHTLEPPWHHHNNTKKECRISTRGNEPKGGTIGPKNHSRIQGAQKLAAVTQLS